jgi:hypothetical protein
MTLIWRHNRQIVNNVTCSNFIGLHVTNSYVPHALRANIVLYSQVAMHYELKVLKLREADVTFDNSSYGTLDCFN